MGILKMGAYSEVDQARAWVRHCFSEQAGTPGSVMELFSGKGKNQHQTVKGSNHAGFSPTRIHATESRNTKQSTSPKMTGLSGGRVRQAIRRLPAIEKNWIVYCYNPYLPAKEDNGGQFIQRLWTDFAAERDWTGVHATTRALVMLLMTIQVSRSSNYADFVKWTMKRPESDMINLSPAQWSNTYGAYWQAIREHIERIDDAALRRLHGMCT